MISHLMRSVLLSVLLVTVTGCAEVRYRGGIVAQIEDYALFRATTKSHRLLRSYILVAGLAAVANNARLNDVEKGQVSGNIKKALVIVQDAYFCLYEGRVVADWSVPKGNSLPIANIDVTENPVITSCIFFDNRMAQLDYAIYKLAATVLLDPDSQSVVATVRDRMIGELPVLGKAVRAASKTIDAANETAETIYDATSLLNALVRVSYNSGERWLTIGAIYRDTLEFDMRLTLHTIDAFCRRDQANQQAACDDLKAGQDIFHNGNGDMEGWREFLKQKSHMLDAVEAHPAHFGLVSRWLYNSCAALFAGATNRHDPETATAILKTLKENCGPMVEYVPLAAHHFAFRTKNGIEKLSSHRVNPSRLVQPAQAPVSAPGPVEAPGSTGTIPR